MSDEKEIRNADEQKDEEQEASVCSDTGVSSTEDTASRETEKSVKELKKNEKKKDKEAERALEAENIKLKEALTKAENERAETEDKYKRVLAEYDNFRKRTSKEKESIYSDAYGDAIKEILPVIDNLERAAACSGGEILKGVQMTLSQFSDTLAKLGVEVIDAKEGDTFNPELHNAVMHTENPELGENTVSALLQKGYKKGDKIYRYAMVAVAN